MCTPMKIQIFSIVSIVVRKKVVAKFLIIILK